MKKLLIVIGIVISTCSCSTTIKVTEDNKEVNGFRYNNGSVTWSNIYQFRPSDFDAVRDWFAKSFVITRENDRSIIGESNKNTLPIRESGVSKMSVVMLFTYPCIVFFDADFKEDRYRVTVNQIIWYPDIAITSYGLSQGIGTMDLNEIAVKNGGYKSVFYNTSSRDLNSMLSYMFTPKLDDISDEDW